MIGRDALALLTRRLATGAVSLVVITLLVSLMIQISGEPAPLFEGNEEATRGVPPQALAEIRAIYHLDRPPLVRYSLWLGDVLRGDLGISLKDRRAVADKIAERLPTTLLLNGLALVATLALALPLGSFAALRPGARWDRWTSPLLYGLYALPVFWAALLLQKGLSVELGWFPLAGLRTSGLSDLGAARLVADRLAHLILPVTCLTYPSVAFIARFVRSNLVEEVGGDARRALLARGHGSWAVWRAGMARAAVPLLTLAGLLLPALVGGSVLVEEIFGIPGLGRLFVEAAQGRDHPVLLALTLLTGAATLLGIVAADVSYAWFDPRVRSR